MIVNHFPKSTKEWLIKIGKQPYDAQIPSAVIEQINSKKQIHVYGWTVADYLVTRIGAMSAIANAVAIYQHLVMYNQLSGTYVSLGLAAIATATLAHSMRDSAINDSLMSIDAKIEMGQLNKSKQEKNWLPSV